MREQHLKVINFYMKGRTKRQSMKDASYSESMARDGQYQVFNHPDVKREIRRRQDRLMRKHEIDANWLVNKLIAIVEADFTEVFEQTDHGDIRVNLTKLSPELRTLITGFTGDRKLRPTFADKNKAIEMLAKHLGLLQETIKIEGTVDLIQKLQEGRKRISVETETNDETSD